MGFGTIAARHFSLNIERKICGHKKTVRSQYWERTAFVLIEF